MGKLEADAGDRTDGTEYGKCGGGESDIEQPGEDNPHWRKVGGDVSRPWGGGVRDRPEWNSRGAAGEVSMTLRKQSWA